MPDIAESNWSERDDHNAEVAPLGWPPGLPAQIELIGRMVSGGVKRFWNRANPVYLTTGTGDNYVITTESQPTNLRLYEIIRVRIDRSNTTATPTLKYARTNARTIVKVSTAGIVPLIAGDLQAGSDQQFWYNGANFVLSTPATVDSSATVGLLKTASNLSELASTAVTARGNIGAAPLASPTFTGTVTIPAGASISGFAPLATPALTGAPTAPTPAAADNSTKIATTAYADAIAALKLSLTGGIMTGAIQDAVFAPSSAATKKVTFDNTLITAGQTRNIKVPDADVALTKWELIGDLTITASTAQPVINLSPFRKIRISGLLVTSVAASILLRTSTNNGAPYDAGASDYAYQVAYTTGASQLSSGGNATTSIVLTQAGNDAGGTVTFDLMIEGFNKAAIPGVLCRTGFIISGVFGEGRTAGQRNQATARNALQILPSAGTMTGTITIEGIRG